MASKTVAVRVMSPREFARKLYTLVYRVSDKAIQKIEQDYEDGFCSGPAWGLKDKYCTLLAIATGVTQARIARHWGCGLDFPECPAKIRDSLHRLIPYFEQNCDELQQAYLQYYPREYKNFQQDERKAS